MNWPIILASAVALLGGGGGLWSALTIGSQRRKLAAETAAIHTESALKLVGAVRTDAEGARVEAAEARREAAEARREATDTRRHVTAIRTEVMELGTALSKLVLMIHDPKMTIERLRQATQPPTPPVDDV